MIDKINDLLKRVEAFKTAGRRRGRRVPVRNARTQRGNERRVRRVQESGAGVEKRAGQKINALKTRINDKIAEMKSALENTETDSDAAIDMTRPGSNDPIGSRHPISLVRNEIVDIFARLGYTVAEGPGNRRRLARILGAEFSAGASGPRYAGHVFHPQNPDILLRTHTSSIQVRTMERQKPPIRVVCPGRVFRNEAISYRAHCIFHQVEGLYIDENVSFADLKQSILYFAKEMFGEKAQIRMRPSYFLFTEPSAEVDVSCNLCGGKGCNVCKHTGWLEIMGCGMVDPNVLEASGIDPQRYSGFAFGMGVERIAMLKYGVKDLRLYFENDAFLAPVRFCFLKNPEGLFMTKLTKSLCVGAAAALLFCGPSCPAYASKPEARTDRGYSPEQTAFIITPKGSRTTS